MILVTQVNDEYQIRFPYDANIIEIVKSVPGRRWNPEGKFWAVPTARLGFLIQHFKGTVYENQLQIQSHEDINVNATLNEKQNIPNIDISEYKYRIAEGLKPYQHQLDSLKFYKYRYTHGLPSGFVLADEPGLAKTAQVCNIALHMRENYGAKHCLIIACVNSAKYNWVEDIIKHTNGHETPYILGSHLKRNGEVAAPTESEPKLTDLMNMTMYGKKDGESLPYFIILNIEAIRMRRGKTYPIAERLIELISNKEISLVALDEIHRNCLEYDTLIQTDKGSIKIGEIVENKLKVNVLSYDTNSNQLVYCPVVDWHTNTTKSKLIELTIQEGKRTSVITCTLDHEFYTTNRGWVAASELNEYDDIVFNKESQ